MSKPVLWIVIPCYNEEQVLPITAGDHDPEYGLGHCFIAPYL